MNYEQEKIVDVSPYDILNDNPNDLNDFDCTTCNKKCSLKKVRVKHNKSKAHLDAVHAIYKDISKPNVNVRCSYDDCEYENHSVPKMNLHIQMIHGGGTNFVCARCGKSYPDRAKLERHNNMLESLRKSHCVS